jgi:Xaa-Pro aminopeptidase
MDENGLEGLVATTAPNVFYLSGHWSQSLVLFPQEAQIYAVISRENLTEPVVVVTTGELDTVLDSFPAVRAINYGSFYRYVAEEAELTSAETRLKELAIDRQPEGDALEGLMSALEETGLTDRTIGLDENGIDPDYQRQLKKHFPSLEIRPAASLFEAVRMVKTQEEIRRLRAAVEVTETAILRATSIAKEGVSESEIAKEFEKGLIDQGAQPLFTCLRVGRLTAFGQRPPGDAPLEEGDRIWLDVGCRYEGYSSDIMRTLVLGNIGERARRYYQAVLEGQERGLQTARAGVKAEDVFHAAVSAVREAGIPDFRRHNVGHGMGIWLYDPPMLAPGNETVLEEGMVLNIETPYYEIGTGALGVEDTFVVTADRPELLTTISRGLESLE